MTICKMQLQLREITGEPAFLEQVYALRVLAWRAQVALPPEMLRWKDAVDDSARHWAFLHATQVIAAVRLSLHGSIEEMPHPEVFSAPSRSRVQSPTTAPLPSILTIAASGCSPSTTRLAEKLLKKWVPQ